MFIDEVLLDILSHFPTAKVLNTVTIQLDSGIKITLFLDKEKVDLNKLDVIISKINEIENINKENINIIIYDNYYTITNEINKFKTLNIIVSKRTPMKILENIDFSEIFDKMKETLGVIVFDKYGNYDVTNLFTFVNNLLIKPKAVEFPLFENGKLNPNKRIFVIIPSLYNQGDEEIIDRKKLKFVNVSIPIINEKIEIVKNYYSLWVGDTIIDSNFTLLEYILILQTLRRVPNSVLLDINTLTFIKKNNLIIIYKNDIDKYVSNRLIPEDIVEFILGDYYRFIRYNEKVVKIKKERYYNKKLGFDIGLITSKINDNIILVETPNVIISKTHIALKFNNFIIVLIMKRELDLDEMIKIMSEFSTNTIDDEDVNIIDNKLVIQNTYVIDPFEPYPKTIHLDYESNRVYIDSKYNYYDHTSVANILFTVHKNDYYTLDETIKEILYNTKKIVVRKIDNYS